MNNSIVYFFFEIMKKIYLLQASEYFRVFYYVFEISTLCHDFLNPHFIQTVKILRAHFI